jgi:hypothetical protein
VEEDAGGVVNRLEEVHDRRMNGFLSVLGWSLIVLGSVAYAQDVHLLLPGATDYSDVYKKLEGKEWTAGLDRDSGCSLAATVLHFQTGTQKSPEGGDLEYNVLVVPDRKHTKWLTDLIRPGSPAKCRKAEFTQPKSSETDGTIPIQFPGHKYEIQIVLSSHTNKYVRQGRLLTFALFDGPASQQLAKCEGWNSKVPWLYWAGDADGDGRLDLIMNEGCHYLIEDSVLYLSSKAAKGQLVGRSAVYKEPITD